MEGFGNEAGSSAYGLAVIQLGGQHILLHVAGKPEQKGQQHQQHQCKAAIPEPNHRQNADDPAGIGEHTDNAGGEQALHASTSPTNRETSAPGS